MALRVFLSIYLLVLTQHLPLPTLASSSGSLALFLDEICREASIINPSVSLPLDTCLVTAHALGIAVTSYPQCTSGNASIVLYGDISCANTLDSNLDYENCYFDGPNGVPAVLFACKSDAGGAAATATSTVTAGSSIIPVAPNTPIITATPSGGTNEQTAPASNNGGTTTSPSSTTPSSTTPSQTPTSSSGTGTGSGLSLKSQIALGVALPVGAIVVALLAWWFPCGKGRG